MVQRTSHTSLAVALSVAFTACGGDRPNPLASSGSAIPGGSGGGSVTVHLSAGTPVTGATITVYAVHDATGQINTTVGQAGAIGVGGPTDATGTATVTLSMPEYSGPMQVVASGSSLSYVDPTTAAADSGQVALKIPASFTFSSFVPSYAAGAAITVPVNLLTTLADREALAYARGSHPAHPGTKPLTTALTERDRLFVQHIATSNAWSSTALRTTVPATLAAGPTTLNEAAYAAFFDVALSSLAHSTATAAGYPDGSTAITAITLAQLLEQDVDADGVFDGKGTSGAIVVTPGAPTELTLNSQFLRIPLAKALDTWVQSKSANASGIRQGDLVASGVYVAISSDKSDLFGAAPEGIYNPRDQVPPEVSFVTEPPKYVAVAADAPNATVSLSISTADESGVANVWCQVLGQVSPAFAAGNQADGTWSCDVWFPKGTGVQVAVWADDQANPPNSGKDAAPPYRLTRGIIADSTPPTAHVSGTIASFRDETGMTVRLDAAGLAAVPPAYSYAGPGLNVAAGATIKKAATTTGWLIQPDPATLEGPNPDNIPVVQYAVPYNPQSDSPIAVATATVTVSVSSGPTTTVGPIALWPSSQSDGGNVYFDLPLASNLIPALATLTAPATLIVSLFLADAAGNSATVSGGTFSYELIGPPVGVSEDTAYATAADPASTYAYKIGESSYSTLFSSSPFSVFDQSVVRLVHLVVTNPASTPISFAPALGASSGCRLTETWTGFAGAKLPNHEWVISPPSSPACPPKGSPPPCKSDQVEVVTAGGILSVLTCGAPADHPIPGARTFTDPLGSTLKSIASVNGIPASVTASGRYIVPAAHDGLPGRLDLFVGRALDLYRPTSGFPSLTWDGSQFTNRVEDVWKYASWQEEYPACGGGGGEPWHFYEHYIWTGTRIMQKLVASIESFSGSIHWSTAGVSGVADLGSFTPGPGSFSFDRTVTH